MWILRIGLQKTLSRVRAEGGCGAAPPNGRNVVSRKMSTCVGRPKYEPLELFCLGTKVHKIFSPNVERVVD